MKNALPLLAALIALPATGAAQDIAPKDSERDPVLSALLQAESDTPALVSPELVTSAEDVEPAGSATEDDPPPVVVDSPEDTPEEAPEEPGQDAEESQEAVLVTGTPPDSSLLMTESLGGTPEETSTPKGLRVQVEPGRGPVPADPSHVRILAPFPAKPLSPPPAGWKLVHPDHVPAFSQTVQLSGGSEVTLSIRPHVLVPDADGSEILALSEPGYQAEQLYAQSDTIGAVLADSIHALDENADRLDSASRRLEELLTSLPVPPPVAEPVTNP